MFNVRPLLEDGRGPTEGGVGRRDFAEALVNSEGIVVVDIVADGEIERTGM
ncbi:MAG: hypothetical protein AAGB11_04865 [Pseudomonadota bacterium]